MDSDETFQQIQEGEEHASRNLKYSTAQNLETVEYNGDESNVQSQQQVFNVNTTYSNPMEAAEQGYKPSLEVPSALLPRCLSIDDLMKMDQRECNRRLAAVVGNSNEHNAIRDRPFEPTPPITKPAERSMSIERLKALNPASVQQADARIVGAQGPISNLAVDASTDGSKETSEVDKANPLAGATIPLPNLIVVPNTPTDEDAPPSATKIPEPSHTSSDCGVNATAPLEIANTSTSYGLVFPPDRPGGAHLQHQGSPVSRSRVRLEEDREVIDNQVSYKSARESTQAVSVQRRSKSVTAFLFSEHC